MWQSIWLEEKYLTENTHTKAWTPGRCNRAHLWFTSEHREEHYCASSLAWAATQANESLLARHLRNLESDGVCEPLLTLSSAPTLFQCRGNWRTRNKEELKMEEAREITSAGMLLTQFGRNNERTETVRAGGKGGREHGWGCGGEDWREKLLLSNTITLGLGHHSNLDISSSIWNCTIACELEDVTDTCTPIGRGALPPQTSVCNPN